MGLVGSVSATAEIGSMSSAGIVGIASAGLVGTAAASMDGLLFCGGEGWGSAGRASGTVIVQTIPDRMSAVQLMKSCNQLSQETRTLSHNALHECVGRYEPKIRSKYREESNHLEVNTMKHELHLPPFLQSSTLLILVIIPVLRLNLIILPSSLCFLFIEISFN